MWHRIPEERTKKSEIPDADQFFSNHVSTNLGFFAWSRENRPLLYGFLPSHPYA